MLYECGFRGRFHREVEEGNLVLFRRAGKLFCVGGQVAVYVLMLIQGGVRGVSSSSSSLSPAGL